MFKCKEIIKLSFRFDDRYVLVNNLPFRHRQSIKFWSWSFHLFSHFEQKFK